MDVSLFVCVVQIGNRVICLLKSITENIKLLGYRRQISTGWCVQSQELHLIKVLKVFYPSVHCSHSWKDSITPSQSCIYKSSVRTLASITNPNGSYWLARVLYKFLKVSRTD